MAIPNMSLKIQQFAPAGFAANQYVYNPIDYAPLERSMAAREARMDKAATQHMNVNNILGQIEPQLHQDEETKRWFANYKKHLNDIINLDIEAGDYGEAFRTATRLAGDVANDSALQGRVKANADYNKFIQTLDTRVKQGKISETTRRRVAEENPYFYKDITDMTGNVIGGSTFEADEPVDDMNWAEHTARAFALIRPDIKSTNTVNGGMKGKELGTTQTTGYEHQLEQVRYDEIYNNARQLLAAESDGINKLQQSLENDKYTRRKLEEELDNLDPNNEEYKAKKEQLNFLNSLLNDNSSTITDLNAYYARKVMTFANSLAYKKESIGNKDIIDWPSGRGAGSGTGDSVDPLDQQHPMVPGAKVTWPGQSHSSSNNTVVANMAACIQPS